MKKLLISTSTFPANDDDHKTARFVLDLAVKMSEYYKVYVLAPHSSGAKREEETSGISVRRFRYFFPVSIQALAGSSGMLGNIKKNPLAVIQVPFFLFAEFFALLRIVRKEGIDIVNSHWIVPQGLLCSLLKKITKVKHVMTVHAAGIFLLKKYKYFGKMISGMALSGSDLVLPVSRYISAEIEKVSGKTFKKEIIPMGANDIIFKPKEIDPKKRNKERPFTFIFVGKMAPKKGLDVLINAAGILNTEGKEFEIIIAGGGRELHNMEMLGDDLGLSGKIKFLGWVRNEDLPGLFSISDVIVVPSVFDKNGETEGMPVVIQEALACGVPVLASRISGIPDVVIDGKNGWLCSPGDASGLAVKMKDIMEQKCLGTFKREALLSAERNTMSRIAEKYTEAIGILEAKN